MQPVTSDQLTGNQSISARAIGYLTAIQPGIQTDRQTEKQTQPELTKAPADRNGSVKMNR